MTSGADTRSQSAPREEPVHIIQPRSGWFDIDIAGVWRYRDLVRLLVRRDFVAFYKQTILGPIWYLLQPLANSLVFSVIFGQVAKLPTDGLPPFLFYLAGMVCWSYFSSCVLAISATFSANAALLGKVYFPRLVIPVSVAISNLMSFAIQLVMLLLFIAWFSGNSAAVRLTPLVLLTPILVAQMAALGLGVGLVVAALTTRFRDLAMAIGFGMSLWMFATPIVYPFSRVPDSLQLLFLLNPMTGVVEVFRMAYLGSDGLSGWQYGLGFAISLVILLVGVVVFSRFEKSFVDTI